LSTPLAPGTEFYEEPKYPNIWRKVNYYVLRGDFQQASICVRTNRE